MAIGWRERQRKARATRAAVQRRQQRRRRGVDDGCGRLGRPNGRSPSLAAESEPAAPLDSPLGRTWVRFKIAPATAGCRIQLLVLVWEHNGVEEGANGFCVCAPCLMQLLLLTARQAVSFLCSSTDCCIMEEGQQQQLEEAEVLGRLPLGLSPAARTKAEQAVLLVHRVLVGRRVRLDPDWQDFESFEWEVEVRACCCT